MPKPVLTLIVTTNEDGLTFEQWRNAASFTQSELRANALNRMAMEAWLGCEDTAEWWLWNEKRRENSKKLFSPITD